MNEDSEKILGTFGNAFSQREKCAILAQTCNHNTNFSGELPVARPLVFAYSDRELAFSFSKVDRSKLYGFKEAEVISEDDEKCELATLGDDGHTIVGRGGTGIGYLSADGEWCDKSALKPVDQEGREIKPVPSSFSAPVELNDKANMDEYLNHNIRLLYVLNSDDDWEDLFEELQTGAIFSFPYSYRGGLVADAGFLLMGDANNVFLAVGNPTKAEFIGLQESAPIEEDVDRNEDEDDDLDFDMI